MKNKLFVVLILVGLFAYSFPAVFNRVNTLINTPIARQYVVGNFEMGMSFSPYVLTNVLGTPAYWEEDYYINYALTDFLAFGFTRINGNDIAMNIQMLLAKDIFFPKLNLAVGMENILGKNTASTFDSLNEKYVNNMAFYMATTYRHDQFEITAGLGDSRLSNSYRPYSILSNLFYSVSYLFSKDGKNSGRISFEYDSKDYNLGLILPLTNQLNLKFAVLQLPLRAGNNPAYGDIPYQNFCVGLDFTVNFFNFYGEEYSKLSGKIKDVEDKSNLLGEKYQTALGNASKAEKLIVELSAGKDKLNREVALLIKDLRKEKEQMQSEIKSLREVVDSQGFKSVVTLKEDIMKYYYRALQYYYDERYFDAIAELSKAKMINSSIPEIYIRLGSIYWTLGLREEAVDNWKTAYNLDKNNDSLNAFLKTNGISLEKQEVINDKKSKI